MVNAVGGGAGDALHPAEAYPRDAWDWIMELNLRSTIVPTQAAVRAMVEQGHGGAVLNISSVRANLGINAGYSAYVAAKGAISAADPPMGDRMGEIRDPGRTRSCRPSWTRRRSPRCSQIRSSRPASSTGSRSAGSERLDDLVGPAIFLVSDAASFVTGQVLGIDGGLTATQ